jgi:hypothetical protein
MPGLQIGSSPSEKVLQDILNRTSDKRMIRKITHWLFDYKSGLKEFDKLSWKYQEEVLRHWDCHYKERLLQSLDSNITFDQKTIKDLETHSLCVMAKYRREALRRWKRRK